MARWGEQVKRLTKICWQLIASPSHTSDILGKVGLKLALGLVRPIMITRL